MDTYNVCKCRNTENNRNIEAEASIIIEHARAMYKWWSDSRFEDECDVNAFALALQSGLWAFGLTASDVLYGKHITPINAETCFLHDVFGMYTHFNKDAVLERQKKDLYRKKAFEYATKDDFIKYYPYCAIDCASAGKAI